MSFQLLACQGQMMDLKLASMHSKYLSQTSLSLKQQSDLAEVAADRQLVVVHLVGTIVLEERGDMQTWKKTDKRGKRMMSQAKWKFEKCSEFMRAEKASLMEKLKS